MGAEQKLVDSPMTLPFTKTASQIALNTGSGLIACLSGLVEKFQDDGQCRFRNIFQMLAARHRLSRDMAVNPLHGIGRSGGKASGKHCTREWGCQLLQPSVAVPEGRFKQACGGVRTAWILTSSSRFQRTNTSQ